jgi:hypothetical protein
MNLAVDDKCREEFDKLKFRKTDCRYITYKIEKEKIVSFLLLRLSIKSERKVPYGKLSLQLFPRANIDSEFSISNSKLMMVDKLAN